MACDRLPLLDGQSSVRHGSYVLVVGGSFSQVHCPLWIMDTSTRNNSQLMRVAFDASCAQPSARRNATVAVVDQRMYMFGGFVDFRGSSDELWTLDLSEWADCRTITPIRHLPLDVGEHGKSGRSALARDVRAQRQPGAVWRLQQSATDQSPVHIPPRDGYVDAAAGAHHQFALRTPQSLGVCSR